MFVCCEYCVLSGRGLCDELITRPEESCRLWCVVVCDLETSRLRRPWPALGRSATRGKKLLGIFLFVLVDFQCLILYVRVHTFDSFCRLIWRPCHCSVFWVFVNTMGGSRFCGAWNLYNFGGPLEQKECKITNTKLGTQVNNYLGALPGPWEWPVHVRGPEV